MNSLRKKLWYMLIIFILLFSISCASKIKVTNDSSYNINAWLETATLTDEEHTAIEDGWEGTLSIKPAKGEVIYLFYRQLNNDTIFQPVSGNDIVVENKDKITINAGLNNYTIE